MKLSRIGAMGPAEIVERSRQALTKRLERTGVLQTFGVQPLTYPSNNGHCSSKATGSPAPRNGQNEHRQPDRVFFSRFRESARARFFKGVTHHQLHRLLEERMPGTHASVIAQAENICLGRFHLLGYPQLSFGDTVDWHLDPVSGRRAPFVHWSRIDPLDPTTVGDSKIIWELNRHQWLIPLGQAYRCTGDERYAKIFAARVRSWMQANPPGTGINWASSLEVALRLISWSWALFLFRESASLSADLYMDILAWIRTHALHIERYLSYYYSPNTHLTGEALGLFYAGVVFPELGEAARWRALGTRILVHQAGVQIYPDGVYFEQSTYYQRYTVEFYLHFLILATRHGIEVPAEVGQQVQKMLDFLLTVRRPDGSMPQIGDSDGGSLLPLVRRAPDDFRGVFATAAAFFVRADYAWAAGGLTQEVLWLLGPAGMNAFDALPAAPPATPSSKIFADGGYVVMRSDWDQQAHQMILDVGPLGCPVSAGHGHADLLSIQLACFGKPCLIDPATYGYTVDADWRDYFRSSAAHSTVMIDGLSQAMMDGPFKWQQRPRVKMRRWLSTQDFDLADAEHDAYHRLPDPVTHRRRVFFRKPRYWMMVDDLTGELVHQVDLRFQFAPMDVTLSTDGWTLARDDAGHECRILVSATAPLNARLIAGQHQPIQGWVSPDYGQCEAANMLVYSGTNQLPLRMVTLFFPALSPTVVPPVVAVSLQHRRIDLVFEDGLETIHIGDYDISVERVAGNVTG